MPAKPKPTHHRNVDHHDVSRESSSDDASDSGDYGGMLDNMKFLNKNYSREFLAQLPAKIRGRAKLLLSFDDQFMQRKAAHDAAITALRIQYDSIYRPLFEKRRALVTGDVEVTDEDVEKGFPPEHNGKVDIKATPEATTTTTTDTDAKGLPGFWLNAFRHHVIISEMITPRDSEVLSYLTDVTAATLTDGYTVVFTFAPNPFMKGTQLHKTIYTKQEHGEIRIDHTDESPIEWEIGKDVTVELIKKKQHSKKNKNAVRYVTRMEPCESFFNMFKHHDNEDETDQWSSLLMTIYEKVVPFAVEYVTREAPDGSSDISESEMYEDDEEEDEDSDDDEDHHHHHYRGGGGRGGKGGAARGGNDKNMGDVNKQCKQQ